MSDKTLEGFLERYGFTQVAARILAGQLIAEGFIKEEFQREVKR
jgi:hypothetical protein